MIMVLIAVGYLVVVNIVGGAIFFADKRAAEADRRRVPERVLLTLGAAGATPAMLWLSSVIRHKTQKQPFRGLLIAIAVVQVLICLLLFAQWIGLLW